MIQLFLDGMPAIHAGETTIKLTKANPYYSKSESYTYDVVLPLDLAENRKIFGWLQRLDARKGPRTLEARLVVDNVELLTGTAHITSEDEKSVSVQLLGGASSYNYGNKMADTYVDELDLGDWFWTTWPDGSYWDTRGHGGWAYHAADWKPAGTTSQVVERAACSDSGYDRSGQALINNLFSGEYPWVAFPAINSSADVFCNKFAYQLTQSGVSLILRRYDGEAADDRQTEDEKTNSFTVQPYVWLMAEKVAQATGFELLKKDNALYSDDFFRKIFIVNTNNYIECKRCLPHWSVNEWWTEIEQAFGLMLTIDYANRRLALVKRSDHYCSITGNVDSLAPNVASLVELKEVVNEYTVDIDDETEADLSSNNVGFAEYENGPEDLLSEFVLANARIDYSFSSAQELLDWAKQQRAETLAESKDVIWECADGRQFIYSSRDGIIEVNMFRPRIRRETTSDIDIELKIVPARFVETDCGVYPTYTGQPGATQAGKKDTPLGTFAVRALQAPGAADMDWYKDKTEDTIDIDAIINEEEEEGSEKQTSPSDLLYIAIANLDDWDSVPAEVNLSTGGTLSHTFSYPRARLRSRTIAPLNGSPSEQDGNCSLSLIPIEGETNLASKTISNAVQIDATTRYCIKFVADRMPDPGAIFLIRNKRFLCEKIEADIAPSGLKKLMTGYFYEMS